MDYTVQRDNNLPYQTIKITGELKFEYFDKFYTDLIKNENWEKDKHVLWDLRQCNFDSLNSFNLESISYMISRHEPERGKGKSAIVVTRNVDYGIARMFELINENRFKFNFMIFKAMDEAIQWLSQDEE